MTLELDAREAGVVAYALYRFAREARMAASALAQRKESRPEAVDAFFRDADDAERVFAKIRELK